MLPRTEIDFMGVRKIAASISILLVVVSVISLLANSLNFGLDFTSCSEEMLEAGLLMAR